MSDPIPESWTRIRSDELLAAVDPMGAQLSLLRDVEGRDLLWNGDPAFWTGRAPLLFPIVGSLAGGQYRLGTRQCVLPRHGFARRRRFELLESSDAAATFILRADDATLAVYPFHFELEVHFALRGSLLSVSTRVHNTGAGILPASFGYHPAFRWPLPYGESRDEHYLEFEMDEPAPVRRLDHDGLLAPASHPTPVQGRRLALRDSLFDEDALIIDQLHSRRVSYGASRGPRLRIELANTPFLGLWSKPGAPFICIEPWHGISDPQGFLGEFTSKPGTFQLAPGGVQQLDMQLELLAP